MNLAERIHAGYVAGRRERVLAAHLAEVLPRGARVVDVGAGDGGLAARVLQQRPDLQVQGLDVLVRERTHIPVARFDGQRIPSPDAHWDVVLFVDVLHHTADPMVLLREAVRATRRYVVIKDHLADGWLAWPTLRFMDGVGNRRYGVALPCNYWPERRWQEAFAELGLNASAWRRRLGLYPWPASSVFERGLHFLACLERPVA